MVAFVPIGLDDDEDDDDDVELPPFTISRRFVYGELCADLVTLGRLDDDE